MPVGALIVPHVTASPHHTTALLPHLHLFKPPLPPPIPHPLAQLFTLIGLKTNGPLAVSKETVTLAHFLDVADAIVKNVDAIKTLDAQAQVCGVGGEKWPADRTREGKRV